MKLQIIQLPGAIQLFLQFNVNVLKLYSSNETKLNVTLIIELLLPAKDLKV